MQYNYIIITYNYIIIQLYYYTIQLYYYTIILLQYNYIIQYNHNIIQYNYIMQYNYIIIQYNYIIIQLYYYTIQLYYYTIQFYNISVLYDRYNSASVCNRCEQFIVMQCHQQLHWRNMVHRVQRPGQGERSLQSYAQHVLLQQHVLPGSIHRGNCCSSPGNVRSVMLFSERHDCSFRSIR